MRTAPHLKKLGQSFANVAYIISYFDYFELQRAAQMPIMVEIEII